MAKKIVRVEVVAEIEVDPEWYAQEDGQKITDEQIIKAEKENWIEWIGEDFISENITIRDKDENS